MQAENTNFAGISVTGEQVRQVLESAAGRQLLSMLQKNGGQTLQRAMQAAKRGDAEAAKQAMNALLSQKDAQALLSEIDHG